MKQDCRRQIEKPKPDPRGLEKHSGGSPERMRQALFDSFLISTMGKLFPDG